MRTFPSPLINFFILFIFKLVFETISSPQLEESFHILFGNYQFEKEFQEVIFATQLSMKSNSILLKFVRIPNFAFLIAFRRRNPIHKMNHSSFCSIAAMKIQIL